LLQLVEEKLKNLLSLCGCEPFDGCQVVQYANLLNFSAVSLNRCVF
jgi:hypothetical protein